MNMEQRLKDRREFSGELVEAKWFTRGIIWGFILPIMLPLALFFGALGYVGHWLNRVASVDSVVQNYEWFQQQYQDIQAIDSQIDSAIKTLDTYKSENGERKDWPRDVREEYARLSTVRDGLVQTRADRVATYNARSRMITRSLWKSNLPHSL